MRPVSSAKFYATGSTNHLEWPAQENILTVAKSLVHITQKLDR
jgi:hypothetical protein